jgi:hypothetical protein
MEHLLNPNFGTKAKEATLKAFELQDMVNPWKFRDKILNSSTHKDLNLVALILRKIKIKSGPHRKCIPPISPFSFLSNQPYKENSILSTLALNAMAPSH